MHRSIALNAVAVLMAAAPAVAADRPLFESHEPIAVTITAALETLSEDRSEKPDEIDATLGYRDADGIERVLNVRVRPRGNSRRKPDVCDFPPLRLNFRSTEVAGTVFAGQDKLKLVTHCRSRRSAFQQYLLQEYLAYRFFNQITDTSFRVRPLDVTYVWTDARKRRLTTRAFLIESRDELTARTGYRFRTPQRIGRHELDETGSSLVEVFQYAIGNTDWSVLDGPGDERCCHNAILVSAETDPDTYIPVPYDFDYSGIVNTPYAKPATGTARTVRTRFYRGFCRGSEVLEAALERFRVQRAAIYALYENEPGLTPANRAKTLRYLDDFYRTIDTPKRLERRIASRCR